MLYMMSIYWGVALLTIVSLAAVKDLKSFTIPHIYPALVILFWITALPFALTSFLALPDVLWLVFSAAIAFVVGFILFFLNMMGGGDVKLFSAIALWFTPAHLLQLTLLMFSLGLVYTLVFASWRYFQRRKSEDGITENKRESYNNIRSSKIPYGPAIAIGLGAYLAIFSA